MTEKDMENPLENKIPDDEEIIELTDEVPISDEDEGAVIELTEVVSDEDEVIELTEVVSDEDEVIELTEVFSNEEEVIELTEVVSDSPQENEEALGDNANTLPLNAVTPEQIDMALERTIEKIYGQKIERLLVEIVQKKVSEEIKKIKKVILDDSSDN